MRPLQKVLLEPGASKLFSQMQDDAAFPAELAEHQHGLLSVLEENLCCTVRETITATGLRHEMLQRLLPSLVETGRVFTIRSRGRIHLLARRPDIEAHWRQILVMKDEVACWIRLHLQKAGPQSRQQLLTEARQQRSWSTATVHRRLQRLEEAGLVQAIRVDTNKLLSYRAIPLSPLAENLLHSLLDSRETQASTRESPPETNPEQD